MPKYTVKIKAIIEKTITDIEAKTESEAMELAHEMFTPVNDEYTERYEEYVMNSFKQ